MRKPHFLLLEPYYGGSHQAFLQGLQAHLDFSFTLLSLPARKWKMRMQVAAPWFAEQIREKIGNGACFEAILCSSFLDVAVLRSLLHQGGCALPLAVYFHENQFDYPLRHRTDSFQFAALNFTAALCADQVAFNSNYNRETFLAGLRGYLKKVREIDVFSFADTIVGKSRVLYPGLDYGRIDAAPAAESRAVAPTIVWNHRWEHDKNPELFFRVICELADEGLDFRLIVLGQSFRSEPPIFALARKKLGGKILHFGYAEKVGDYARLLKQGDLVVSTAAHEFFGMAVLEAVRAGCRPLVPDGLAYRELFAQEYRYQPTDFKETLRSLLTHFQPLAPAEAYALTERFSWAEVAGGYGDWLDDLLAVIPLPPAGSLSSTRGEHSKSL